MSSVLREARDERGWTLDQVAARLLRLASTRNVSVSASQASLRQMISDMERGRRKVGHYAPLLCELYGKTKIELGLDSPSAVQLPGFDLPTDLIGQIRRSDTIGSEAIRTLQQQVDGIRVLDRQLGSPAVADATKGLVQTINSLVENSFRPTVRGQLAAVLSDAAALNAWQALNSGELKDAWLLYGVAKSAASESGNLALSAHAMGEQAYGLLDLDRPGDALDLIQAAQTVAGTAVPALLGSWLSAAEAEAHATLQNVKECHGALERATTLLPDQPDNSDVPYISLNEWHLARWKGNILAKLGDAQAVRELRQAIDNTDPSFVRATASLECDMAEALITQDQPGEAGRHLRRALQLATSTGSIRQLRRIRTAQKKLA